MSRKNILVRIQRFNPKRDKRRTYKTYKVPLTSGMSVLNILDYIYQNLDSSLAYYNCCCRRGFCKGCYLQVSGKPVLACLQIVKDNIVLKPLSGYEIIKDLYVDIESKRQGGQS